MVELSQLRRFWLRQNDGLTKGDQAETGDEGYLLVGAIVAIFLVMLVLSVAAARTARALQRDKEIESQHRGNQYVRAIRVFYRKNGNRYPSSVEQLENTNNQKFLRQRYLDPLTGKDDWRIIHLGENQTTVKGFFGQELQGLQSGLGSAASLASSTGTSTTGTAGTGSSFGSSSFGSSGSSFGSSSTGIGAGSSGSSFGSSGTSGQTGTAGSTGTSGTGTTGTGTGGSGSGLGSTGSTGLIMGIGSSSTGNSIVDNNGQDTYQSWEFLYDPRIEQLYAKATLFGGAMSSGTPSGLGSASSLASPGQALSPTTTPATPPVTPVDPNAIPH